ncbi:PREDICTED: uncharacterized protein LOC106819609 [Priapulus caudatus]|uniref:Uncharacterized protein LOC106819609 n=1 Tax=Priapulus caudatus TaxID=37621 RepID=A0ABM1F5I4_PRICU|nr:PREDICTED: uncharacterized protein LOC106819609 [Priapulus caudatus]
MESNITAAKSTQTNCELKSESCTCSTTTGGQVPDTSNMITVTVLPTTGGQFQLSLHQSENVEGLRRTVAKKLKAASLKALHISHDASTAHTDAEWSLVAEDDADVAAIVEKYLPQINSHSLLRNLLLNQEQNLGRATRGRRWNPEVVKACLSLWASNPRTYKKLSSLGMLVTMPSGRLLCYYKNSVHQKPGLNNDMLLWMYEEAKSKQVPPHGMTGGIVFDEMSIQSDLQIIYSEGQVKIIGLVDMGAECSAMQVLKQGKASAQLGTHVLLFMFQGDSGFRFPFMHVPTTEATAPDIYVLFWKAVRD